MLKSVQIVIHFPIVSHLGHVRQVWSKDLFSASHAAAPPQCARQRQPGGQKKVSRSTAAGCAIATVDGTVKESS